MSEHIRHQCSSSSATYFARCYDHDGLHPPSFDIIMSSITTAVPTGILPGWCLGNIWGFDGQPNECGDGTLYASSDFWTVCCDGEIVNVKENIWTGPNMTMENLICCRHIGKLQGGLHPLPAGPPWTCELDAVGTSLASLAATNTDNAGVFVATYASAN